MRRLRAGEWLALVGALGLIATLFADWFSGPQGGGLTGWTSLGWFTLALVLVSVVLIAMLWLAFVVDTADIWNLIPGVTLAVLAPLTAIVLLVDTLLKPGEATGIESAGWIGLACGALMVVGVLASLRNERTSGPGREFQPPPARPAPPA